MPVPVVPHPRFRNRSQHHLQRFVLGLVVWMALLNADLLDLQPNPKHHAQTRLVLVLDMTLLVPL